MNNSLVSLINDNPNKRKYVFELFTSVNNRYLIVEDNIFDFETQTELGNIWESIDNFKAIFNNTIVDNTEYLIVRESILKLPILENNNTLYGLRDILLEYNFFDDTWVGREMKKAGTGTADFLKTSYEGAKKMGVAIGSGEWSEILTLLQKGVLYALRKLKDALYSTVGGVVDAILVATGIGKVAQVVPWALVTTLDIYQLKNNDWPAEEKNDPMWSKYLTIGFDILGLASTGAVAIGARKALMPVKALASNPSKLAKYLLANPKLKIILQKMVEASSIASSKIKTTYNYIKSKFPAGATFMGTVIGYMDEFFKKFSDSINKLINPKNIKTGTIAGSKETALNYGIEKALSSFSNTQIANLSVLSNYFKQFSGGRMSLSEAAKNVNFLTTNKAGDVSVNKRYKEIFTNVLTDLNLDVIFFDKVEALPLNKIDMILDDKIKNIDLNEFKKDYTLPPDLIEAIQMKIVRTVLETNGSFTKKYIDAAVIKEIDNITKYTKTKIPFSIFVKKLFKPKNTTKNTDIGIKTDANTLKYKKLFESKLIAKFGKNSKEYKWCLKQFEDVNLITTKTELEEYAAGVINRLKKDKFKFNIILKSFGSMGSLFLFIIKFIKFLIFNPIKSLIGYSLLFQLFNYGFSNGEESLTLHLENMAKFIGTSIKNEIIKYNKLKNNQKTSTDVDSQPNNKVTLQPGQLDE